MFSERPLPVGGIRLEGVTKTYDRAGRKSWSMAWPWAEQRYRTEFTALSEVDLDIVPGEAVGLIGTNGAGKSTVLKLIAGVIAPNAGTVASTGAIGSMIELGLGFHLELTGSENVRSAAAILGMDTEAADAATPAIIEFAGIEDAMDTPLKHYSTGMQARLGFAVSVHVPADILLIDEVLAVGDSEFQLRCVERIAEMHERGTTLVFVSHATFLMAEVCDRVIQLRQGRLVDDGPSTKVIQRYLSPQPVDLDRAETSTMHLRSVDIATRHVRPWDPIELTLEVEVTDVTSEPALAVDLNYATLAPEYTIASTSTPVPDALRRPGVYRLTGRSSSLPLDSGHIQARVALVDETSQRVLDSGEDEFWIDGTVTRRSPHIATEATFALEPLGTGPSLPMARSAPADVSPDWVVQARHVSKRFHAGLRKGGFRAALPASAMATPEAGEVVALHDVSLDVAAGECLGIVGPNGSGKSTILKAIAGVVAPTDGVIRTRGRLVSMLELGIGFHKDLTGAENLRQTAGLLGMSRPELEACWDAVLAFADIGEAIDAPVKQYSSGMRIRLGLALAVTARPDLLLIDEALAVGDRGFQKKAVESVRALVASGTGAVFVSHDLGLVEEISDRVVRLEQGRVVDQGPARDVIDRMGGTGWDCGLTQVGSAVRVDELTVRPRHLPPNGSVSFEGQITVFEPSPTVRLEFALMARTGNPTWLTEERMRRSVVFSRVMVPAGGPLSETGRFRFSGKVDRNPLIGELYALISAVDERESELVARAWHELKIGTRVQMEVLTLPLTMEWEVLTDADTEADAPGSTPPAQPA